MTLTRLAFHDSPWVREHLTAAQRVVLVKRAATLGAEHLAFSAKHRGGPFMAALAGGRFDSFTDRAWGLSPMAAAETLFARVDPDTAYACQCDVCPCREPAVRGSDGVAKCERCEEAHP